MAHLSRRLLLLAALTTFVVIQSGCAYMGDRGRDFLDITDFGITVTDKAQPDFGVYLDFFNITPLGYSMIDGKVLGWGNRQIGWLDYHDHNWGALVWGSEQKGTGAFVPRDPHQTRLDQVDAKAPPRFNAGIARLIAQDNRPPWLQFIECDRGIHLGWIGVHLTFRPFETIDFLLGWTTLDVMGDDEKNLEKRADKGANLIKNKPSGTEM